MRHSDIPDFSGILGDKEEDKSEKKRMYCYTNGV